MKLPPSRLLPSTTGETVRWSYELLTPAGQALRGLGPRPDAALVDVADRGRIAEQWIGFSTDLL
jgi:hypothetical protein